MARQEARSPKLVANRAVPPYNWIPTPFSFRKNRELQVSLPKHHWEFLKLAFRALKYSQKSERFADVFFSGELSADNESEQFGVDCFGSLATSDTKLVENITS